MLSLIIRWLVNALILMVLSFIVRGVQFDSFYAALLTALLLGVVNALIKPFLLWITLPFNILTLGLFTIVINGLLFWLVSTIVKGFYVADFWSALLAALLFSVFSIAVNWIDHKVFNKSAI